MAWVLDLDGVVWRGERSIAGASEAVARLRAAGETVWFVTNNALPQRGEVEAKLADQGIDAAGAVITSPMAAAGLLQPGERVLVCGGPGVAEAIVDAGAEPFDRLSTEPVDAVVVGLHRTFDYEGLAAAAGALHRGARLIATNDDATFPAEDRLLPGAGSILAAVATAGRVAPTIAGKPHPPMVDLVRSLAGPTGFAVGDRPDTDGRFARALGYRFGLVLTGVTTEADLPVDPEPDLVAADLLALVDAAIATGSR